MWATGQPSVWLASLGRPQRRCAFARRHGAAGSHTRCTPGSISAGRRRPRCPSCTFPCPAPSRQRGAHLPSVHRHQAAPHARVSGVHAPRRLRAGPRARTGHFGRQVARRVDWPAPTRARRPVTWRCSASCGPACRFLDTAWPAYRAGAAGAGAGPSWCRRPVAAREAAAVCEPGRCRRSLRRSSSAAPIPRCPPPSGQRHGAVAAVARLSCLPLAGCCVLPARVCASTFCVLRICVPRSLFVALRPACATSRSVPPTSRQASAVRLPAAAAPPPRVSAAAALRLSLRVGGRR